MFIKVHKNTFDNIIENVNFIKISYLNDESELESIYGGKGVFVYCYNKKSKLSTKIEVAKMLNVIKVLGVK